MTHAHVRTLVALVALAAVLVGCGGGGFGSTKPAPVVLSVEPATGGVGGGTPLTIKGTGFVNAAPGLSEVLIGDVPATKVVFESDTTVTCETLPHALGSATVTVTKVHGTGALADAFTFYAAPTLTSMDPAEGSRDGGLPFTLTGTGFTAGSPGQPVVQIAGIVCPSVVVLSDTTLQAVTPTAYFEKAVDVTLTNAYGVATLANGFVYKGPVPVVTGVVPSSGLTDGGESVTVFGDFFTIPGGAVSVTFGGDLANNIVRVDDQTLTCDTPPRAPGLCAVGVANTNGGSSLADAFLYVAAPPTLSTVAPSKGLIMGGTAVTLSGTGFLNYGAGTNTVTFGGANATSVVVVNDTTLTCKTPSSASPGVVTVVLTNNRGTATLTNAFTYEVPLMYAATGRCAGNATLYSIDTSTSSYASIGSAGGGISGMAFHPTTGVLYATGDACNAAALKTVDITTGSATSIGGGGSALGDITFAGTVLIGWDNWAPGPVTIDLSSGSTTGIGTTSLYSYGNGLASDASGNNVFFANGSSLYRVSTSTGATTYVGFMSLQYGRVCAMTFHLGELYGVDGSWSSGRLIKINTSTASTTNVMSLPGQIDSLASQYPAAP